MTISEGLAAGWVSREKPRKPPDGPEDYRSPGRWEDCPQSVLRICARSFCLAHDGDGCVRAEAFAILLKGALKVGALAMPEAVAVALVTLDFLPFDVEGPHGRVRTAHPRTIRLGLWARDVNRRAAR